MQIVKDVKNFIKGDVSLKDILSSCADGILIHFDMLSDKGLKKTYEERLAICATCPIFINDRCGDSITTEVQRSDGTIYKGCGCLMICKASNLNNICGAGRWVK